jgi:hypothetical protein
MKIGFARHRSRSTILMRRDRPGDTISKPSLRGLALVTAASAAAFP